jgi:cyclase
MRSYLDQRPIAQNLVFVALGLFFCTFGYTKESVELTKLAEGVYARIVSPDSDAVSNSGIVVLDHCALIFDTHFTPEAGHALLDAARSITPKPICYVVNSHAHADHTHGNQLFPDAQIIGSTEARRDVMESDLPMLNRTMGIARTQLERLRKEMSGRESGGSRPQQMREIKSLEDAIQTMSRLRILAPFITLDDNMIIHDGKQEARVSFLGAGHTDGDVILFLPAAKIAFVGDLFFYEAIPNVQDAHILPWLKTLEEVLKLDADTFVPGHGKAGSKKDVAAFLNYFEELKASIQPAVDRGDSMEQVLQDIQLPAKYSGYQFQRFFPVNVQKIYAELKELQISITPPAKAKAKPGK